MKAYFATILFLSLGTALHVQAQTKTAATELRMDKTLIAVEASPPTLHSLNKSTPLVNYEISIQWQQAKEIQSALRIVTTEGTVDIDTIARKKVKVGSDEMPATINFKGTLEVVSLDKCRLKVFLGRTVPYVTGTYAPGGPNNPPRATSYQQLRVGFDTNVVLTLGKPLLVHANDDEEVSVTIKRLED